MVSRQLSRTPATLLVFDPTDHCITSDLGTIKINFTGPGPRSTQGEAMAAVVTAASGYDLDYVWKRQAGGECGA